MDETFFRSFWNLLLSQLEGSSEFDSHKLLTDLFSTTFLKAAELVGPVDRSTFSSALQDSADKVAHSTVDHLYRINRACVLVLVGWLRDNVDAFEYDLINASIDTSLSMDQSIELLGSPVVARVVSTLITQEGRVRLIQAIEQMLLPRLSNQDEKVRFLSACQFVASDIESMLAAAIESISTWCRQGQTRDVNELTPVLSSILEAPRVVALFRQLPGVALLKERFLVVLAMGLRSAGDSELVESAKKAFFFVPSVGIVMDRWLDKEIQKFNTDVLRRVSGSKNELRDSLATAFSDKTEEWVDIPFGFEEAILSFIRTWADPESNFKELPCALTGETVCTILRQFSQWFEIVSESKSRLTPAGLSLVARPATGASFTAPAAQTNIPDDLVDVLLKEILNRLPQHAFLSRPYPAKVQPGVYRFGTREVTFHTKAGKLYVFRVGGYISESDAMDFISREFSVPMDKLRSGPQTVPVPSAGPIGSTGRMSATGPITTGMRRPMEWDNDKLLVRLVRRGLRARDQIWRQGWELLFTGPPRAAPRDVLQKFLEQHMAHAVRQSWARDLLYYEDKNHELGDSSEGEEIAQVDARPSGLTRPAISQPPEAHPNFKTRLCINWPLGRCTRGSACAYAHGEAELRAGPAGTMNAAPASQHQYYKTRLCQAFMEGRCARGVACNYAHSDEERQAFAGQGVVKRDIRASEDIRLAAKAEIRGRDRSRSRDRYRR
jgi:hypothetical protein